MAWAGVLVGLIALGCGASSSGYSSRGPAQVTFSEPSGCTSLGPVTGSGGGAFGGFVANESLIRRALDDLADNAGEMGATHVHASNPSLGETDGTTTTATVVGTAFVCSGGLGGASDEDLRRPRPRDVPQEQRAEAALGRAAMRARECLAGEGPLIVDVRFDARGRVALIGDVPNDADGRMRGCLAEALAGALLGPGTALTLSYDFRARAVARRVETPPGGDEAHETPPTTPRATATADLPAAIQTELAALLAARRDAILACAGVSAVGLRIAVRTDGTLSISAQGRLADTPEARCIIDQFSTARVTAGSTGVVVRVVQ